MKKLKFNTSFFDKAQTGSFIGQDAINGRVTVEPLWSLNKTNPSYGNSIRGPFRYFQKTTGSTDQYEVPNISSIDINRSLGQDVATCNISMYNMWHEGNTVKSQLSGQLGYPGYFWPKRGEGELDFWSQTPGQGAFKKNGEWNGSFSWSNVLIPHVLIRTYQGYGGNPTESNYTSIDDNLENDNVVLTGLWLVDSVQAGSDGKLTLTCRDIGRILLDQIVFPPVVPGGLYPLEYYPAGKSAFDSPWGPVATNSGVIPGSTGEVRLITSTSSGDTDSTRGNHYNSHSNDGDPSTFSLSEAFASTNSGTVWFQFTVPANDAGGISSLNLTPWAGGYECYISVAENGVWQGTELIPNYGASFGGVKYVTKLSIPQAVPDGREVDVSAVNIQLPREYGAAGNPKTLTVRVYFSNLYYSGIPGIYGNQYRAGIRDIIAYRTGANVSPYDASNIGTLPFTSCIAPHPVRGYWVLDLSGNVYGFGDASYYDSTRFGVVPLQSSSLYDSIGQNGPNWPYGPNNAIGITAHPDGKGYWVLDIMGHVWAYGSAQLFEGGAGGETQHVVRWPVRSNRLFALEANAATAISATHTGNGYYVIYGDGTVYAFGDAMYGMDRWPSGALRSVTWLPKTDVFNWMVASGVSLPQQYYYMHGRGVAAHPKAHGFWATTGSGEVFSYGAAGNYGSFHNRTYNRGMGDQFSLNSHEQIQQIRPTKTGRGYWLVAPWGNVAAFGDAVGQGPVNINQSIYGVSDDSYSVEASADASIFQRLVWDMAPDPDGNGFWVLISNGNVLEYNAEPWGSPGWTGRTGYRWHEGNFNGDWAQIVKDVLLWSGFTLYNPSIGSGTPEVYGMIEDTAIRTDSLVSGEKFDKKTIMDVIKELATVVGYNAYVTEEGLFKFASPNWWQSGNFDENGLPIYVYYDEEGNYTRVGADYEPPDIGPPPANAVLTSGQYLSQSVVSGAGTRIGSQISSNGTTLVMQADGNLVMYAGATSWGRYYPAASTAIWNSGTWGNPGAYAVMQADGNFVVYKGPWASKVAIWNSGTFGNSGSQLHLQYDRNLVIYKPAVVGTGKSAIWDTKTSIDTSILPTPFIPVIDESVDMFSYSATLSGGDDRTEIIIGTDLPDPKDPSRTGYVRHIPPVANEYVWPGIKKLRGIEKPAMWVSALFQNNEEAQLMAELIGIHAWFAQRTGSVSCIANPCITIDDQVRILERNTNETYIHRVTAVDSKMNLDSGEWSYDLTTHWLGDANNWVISNSPQINAPYPYVRISERADSWQSITARGLGTGGAGAGSIERFAIMRGEFDAISETLPKTSLFGIESKSLGALGTGDIDNTLYVNLMLYGNGIKWSLDENATPESFEDSGASLASSFAAARLAGKEVILTLGYCPPYYRTPGAGEQPAPAKYTELADAFIEILSDPTIFPLENPDPVTNTGGTPYYPSRVIVWNRSDSIYFDEFGTTPDYLDFYNVVYDAVKTWNDSILVYGLGVDVTDTTSINYFIDNAVSSGATPYNRYDGIALHGDYTDVNWANHIEAAKEIISTIIVSGEESIVIDIPIIVSLDGATESSPDLLFDSLDKDDIVFWPSNEAFISPESVNAGQWILNGTLELHTAVQDCRLTTDTLTSPLGITNHIEIYDGVNLIFNSPIAAVQEYISIPNIGALNVTKNYTFKVKGIAASTGNGVIKLTLSGDNIDKTSISDTLIVVDI